MQDEITNKKGGFDTEGDTINGVTQSAPPLTITLAELFSNVNPKDVSFLKYVPKQFIDQNNVNLKSTRDSDGNALSKAQQEHFKDSKVRDEDGNILVVHYTPIGGSVDRMYEIAAEVGEKIESGEASEGQKNNTAGGDVLKSVRETTDGIMVAVVDNDILSGIDTSNWTYDAFEKAKEAASDALYAFSDGIMVNGIKRKVNRTTRREFTKSNYTQSLFRNDPTAFADKMRSASIADDVVTVATQWKRDNGLKHARSDNFVDFDHGKTLFMAGSNKYEAEVVVGITRKGEYVFYDVVDVNPTSFNLKEETPTTVTTDNLLDDIHGISSANNISRPTNSVKLKSTRDSDGNSLSKAQQEYFKDSKVRDEDGNLRVVYHGKEADFTGSNSLRC